MLRINHPRVLGLVAGLLLAGQACVAGDLSDIKSRNLFDAGKKVCDALTELLPDKNQAIFVREFRGLASSHVGLSKCIAEELTQAGYRIQEGASIELEGRLVRLPVRDTEPLVGFTVRCTLNLEDGSQQNFSLDVENVDQGHVAVSETGEFHAPPNKPRETPPSPLPPGLEAFEVRPAADSPYGIELLVETSPGQYQSLRPFHQGNLIKVNIPKGAIYAVKVYNRTPFEAAASVYIDGLSRYAMADNPAFRDGLDLIPANGHRIIKGYYRDGLEDDSFQIGSYSESVAARLLPSGTDIGLIAVTFAACWEGNNIPPNEPGLSKNIDPPGTKQGPKRSDPTTPVKRTVGKVRAIVKVRY